MKAQLADTFYGMYFSCCARFARRAFFYYMFFAGILLGEKQPFCLFMGKFTRGGLSAH